MLVLIIILISTIKQSTNQLDPLIPVSNIQKFKQILAYCQPKPTPQNQNILQKIDFRGKVQKQATSRNNLQVCQQLHPMIGKKAEQYFSFILSDRSQSNNSIKQPHSFKKNKNQGRKSPSKKDQRVQFQFEEADECEAQTKAQKSEDRFQAELQKIKRQLNMKYAKQISKIQNSRSEFDDRIIPGKQDKKEVFRKSMKAFFSDYQERRAEKKLIAKTILNRKQFSLKIVRQQFAKAKPGFKICRDRRRTLCQGLSVDFMRSLERYLMFECGVEIQPLKKSNVMYLTKTLTNCKSVMKPEMKQTTLSFLKFIYDLEEVKLNPQLLYELYKSLGQLSDQLILKKYQIAIKKKRPHQLPLSSLFKVAQPKQLDDETWDNPVAELNRSWTSEHEEFLRTNYLQTQSFALIRERFREKFRSDYHLWTMHTLQLRFQRVIREALRTLRMIVYHKNNKHLPALTAIDSRMARVITLRVPFKRIRIQLVRLLANKQDMKNVVELINDLNRECQAWKDKKDREVKTDLQAKEQQKKESSQNLKVQSIKSILKKQK